MATPLISWLGRTDLRALQEGEVTRVGATAPTPVDVRILAATNRRKLLLEHPWPGNVREMQNTLRRAAVWTPGPTIDLEDARGALLPSPTRDLASDPALAQDVAQRIDLIATIDRIARH